MEFYLSINGEKQGPFSMFKVGEMLERDEVDSDTLVWHRDLENWQPISEVQALSTIFERHSSPDPSDEPPPVPGQDEKSDAGSPPLPPSKQASVTIAKNVRPFVRFWARMFDYTMVSVVVFLFSDITLPEPGVGESFADVFSRYLEEMQKPEALVLARTQLFAMIGWQLLEGVLIHLFATTPGKALFGIKVLAADGSRIPVLKSLGRSMYVYVLGAGFYQVPFSIIGMTFSFFRLLGSGKCLWDQHLDLQVETPPVGSVRIMLAIAAFIGLIMLQSLKLS